MMFFGMAVMIPVIWFLPWWSMGLASLWLGFISGPRPRNAVTFACAAGLVWAALAFLKDGKSSGIISQRMSAMFTLPFPPLIFVLVFVLGFVTAFLCFRAGAALSVLYKAKTVSPKPAVS